jgi:hypothetical protein
MTHPSQTARKRRKRKRKQNELAHGHGTAVQGSANASARSGGLVGASATETLIAPELLCSKGDRQVPDAPIPPNRADKPSRKKSREPKLATGGPRVHIAAVANDSTIVHFIDAHQRRETEEKKQINVGQ